MANLTLSYEEKLAVKLALDHYIAWLEERISLIDTDFADDEDQRRKWHRVYGERISAAKFARGRLQGL